MIRTIHHAKYVLAEADLLLQDAAVHVCDPGRISRIEPWQGRRPAGELRVVDWGSAILMPGLVNCHTHLELTALSGRLSSALPFVDWLAALEAECPRWTAEDFRASAESGAGMVLESGTTLVGDVTASGESRSVLRSKRIRKVVFQEAVALEPEMAADAAACAERRLGEDEPDHWYVGGLSPHAPFSVSPRLYRELAALALRRAIPLATHAAETGEELQFLESGTGRLRELLESLGMLPSGWAPPKLHPIHYLEVLGFLEAAPLLIHCNHLDADSMAVIQKKRCSIAYCPRSHARFGNEDHPVRQCLDLGINVALGTGSAAGSASLSILDEMRFLRQQRKDLKVEEIFRMATLNGAAALNFGSVLGRLRRGYWADMTVLRLPEGTGGRNLPAQILEGAGDCIATIVGGEVVWEHASGPGSAAAVP
jgi:cytosine/adenosine deaminase-related metal-dependent hydrolase